MKKLPGRSIISLLILFALIITFSFILAAGSPQAVKFGVTFTPRYAKYLKLDWQRTYLQVLDDLQVKNLRLLSYWDSLEPQRGQFDFKDTDYLLDEAGKRGARVILVVGVRQPRWPECHIPAWAKDLPVKERQKEALALTQKVVTRYKDNGAIWAWQVENEPLLQAFGEGCDFLDNDFVKREVALVRTLTKKPIIMTDSGELGLWVTSMQMSDIFGTTVYRQVYDRWLGYVTYPVLPNFYSLKSSLIRNLFAPNNQKTIIAELQAEPWFAEGKFLSAEQQARHFTIDNLKSYVSFAQKTGFDEAYLWGVEWWYFMVGQGYPEYLDFAKSLFKRS